MVAIIDYGMGNLASVKKALDFLKLENIITADPETIRQADTIVLPGVGSFGQGMKHLSDQKLDVLLTEEVIGKGKKFLGICLGMQLIMESGTEPEPCKGLGWIKGSVEKFDDPSLRVPHIGWNDIRVLNNKYFQTIQSSDFYFIHGYHVVPADPGIVSSLVNYGTDIVASIQKGNIFATQFHPEKSQSAGLAVLKAFFSEHA